MESNKFNVHQKATDRIQEFTMKESIKQISNIQWYTDIINQYGKEEV